MRQKKGMAQILLATLMLLAVGFMTGDILGDAMKIVKVDDYVCKTCSLSESWTSDKDFEQSIMFDYKIDCSISGHDAVLYLLDADRTLIKLYSAPNVFTHTTAKGPCTIHRFSYPQETYIIKILPNTAELRTIDGILVKTISIVNRQGPYNLHVNVINSRGIDCGYITGSTLQRGIVYIGNIAILDVIPEPEPIIIPSPTIEPEPVTEPYISPIADIIDDIKDIITPEGKAYVDYIALDVPDIPITYVEPTIHPVRQFMDNIVSIAYKIKLWIFSI